ncbi:MAG: hypothetical protein RBT74_15480, partial [Tenuifilaceae bacterium]|nr:hypothetical protein [Tenuifilaceae bacterium]
MGKRVFNLLVILLLNINLFAQQDFSLSKYFVANPMVGAAIEFKHPSDMVRVENNVKSLIQTGNFNFPDIYGSNLTPYPNEWASYPDSVLWNVYYAYAAFSIYIDYSNRVPWKLSELKREQLKDFFYTEYLFNSYFKNFGTESTPTNPIFTYSFLIENNLIGKTRKETMERLFQWSRYKLQHFLGSPSPENFVAHWQHNDGPPVERVITGTTLTDNGEFSHWSRGCVGATMFFANVLRVINIPVKPISIGTHVGMDFPSERLLMTHGDDPYGIMDEINDVEIHAKEIFVPYAEIDSIKALGFEGNDIVSYGSHKVVAKHFPLNYYHPTDTNITYTRFSNALLYYTRSDTTQQYYQIMDQARTRYSAVDVDRYLEISNLKGSDSLWYKTVYGLNQHAYLDTVLITNDIGYARVINDKVHVFVDETTTEINPVFIRNADSFINIQADSIINLNNTNQVTIAAEDSILMVTYSIIKNTLPRYSVTLTPTPEGAGVCAGDGFYLQGTIVTIMAASAKGLRFVKWTEADTLVSLNSSYTFTPENDRSFVAHFDTLEYTIAATIEPDAGGTVDGVGIYKHGNTVDLTAIPADGYQFVGWKKWIYDNYYYISFEPTISFVAEQDTSFIAEFAINWHLVSVTSNPSYGGTVSEGGWYPFGTQVTVTATPADDWVFINWVKWTPERTDTLSTNPEYSFVLENNIYLIANFAKEYTLTVTTNPKEGGVVSGSGVYYAGTYTTITATPSEGYRFVNYTDDNNPDWVHGGRTLSIYVEKDRNLTANFVKRTYTIYAYPNNYEAGTISGDGVYEFGDNVELVATPNAGYEFVNWTEGGTEVSTSSTYDFTATADRNLVANFVVQSYTITAMANPVEGGYISGTGNYNHNSTVNLVATPNTGYEFVNWTDSENEVSTNEAFSFTATTDRNLVANFVVQSYTITAMANPVEGGYISGTGNYNHNSTVNLVATPNTGYEFVNWTDSENE